MTKFKVGQKVRVKTDIEVGSHSSNNTDFVEQMSKFKGKVVTIAEIHSFDGKDYDIEEDNDNYSWAEDWLEPVYDVKTKDDLKDGDVVTLRNRDRLIYCDGQFKDLTYPNHNGICDTYDIEDDLTGCTNDNHNDIMKVERPLSYYEVFNRNESVKEMTLEEISKALGYEVKIVKEK